MTLNKNLKFITQDTKFHYINLLRTADSQLNSSGKYTNFLCYSIYLGIYLFKTLNLKQLLEKVSLKQP